MKALIILMAIVAVGCTSTHKKSVTIQTETQSYEYSNEIIGSEGFTEASIDDLTIDFQKNEDGVVKLRASLGKSYTSLQVQSIEKLVDAYKENPEAFQSLPERILGYIRTIAGMF